MSNELSPKEKKLIETLNAFPSDRSKRERNEFNCLIIGIARDENRIDEYQQLADTADDLETVYNTIFSVNRVEIVDEDWDVEE